MSGTRIHDVAETSAFAERRLRDGTPLTYKLTVLQQPMIARACGMGAKSHADRRPVDPPPVVELKIFSGEEKSDITFSHNSNFFLFATLEQARPIAQGRGMPAPAPQPVLTGVPVSGMAYLDRPTPGGYFIFPDLSVRHEGKYRLRFALYEETKDRDEIQAPVQEGGPTEWAAFRVEVKSKPFTVYSAKKFPGLKESTALSRIVAEQGCRVRIRRDVRMRRRSDRHGRDGDIDMDETAMIRARGRRETPEYDDDMRGQGHHQPTQHPHPHHPQAPHHAPIHPMQRPDSVGRKRSDSDASIASMPDVPPPAPRFDERYTPRQEHNPYGPPPPAARHHLAFGSTNVGSHPAPPSVHPPQVYNHNPMPRYQTGPTPVPQQHQPPHAAPRPPPPMSSTQYTPGPPPPQYREGPMNGHMQHARRGSASQDYHAPPPPPTNDHVRRESDTLYRAPQHYRPSTPSISQPSGHYHSQMEATYAPPQYQPPPPPPPPQYQPQASLPPLKLPPLAMEPLPWSRSSVSSPSTNGPPPAPLPSAPYGPPTTSMVQHQPHPQSQYHGYGQPAHAQPPYISAASAQPPASVPEPVNAQPEEPRGTKRQWGRVFNNSHVTEPLHNGRRPDTTSNETTYGQEPANAFDDDDEFDIGKLKMRYRRADGEEIVRRLPLDE